MVVAQLMLALDHIHGAVRPLTRLPAGASVARLLLPGAGVGAGAAMVTRRGFTGRPAEQIT